jgi:hypothetical protein
MITLTAAPRFSGIYQIVTRNKSKENDKEVSPTVSKLAFEKSLKSNKARNTLLDFLQATDVAFFLYSNPGQPKSLIAITDEDKTAFVKLREFANGASSSATAENAFLTNFIYAREKNPYALPKIYLNA